MSEEEATEGYYSDAPVPSPLACGSAAEQGAQALEECYESDEASTISSYESDAPMELETLTDEEQTEDEGSDGCIPNSVLDSWMATQVLP
ncbi:hypothetical protein CVT26_011744 [Gymnopilus dilepis]|uniref:Uncharacterized protein n=1 Tax=Gymnopilus dilepis TaxID=231916 RepID=A0A409W5T0_9AGAR|nr:hypothetical protein CVT26_011744 [Gymnopilus dilepis]